jgi:hypothetical protein
MNNDTNNTNNTPQVPEQNERLSHETVYALAGVFARLEQLRTAPPDIQILRPNGEASRTPGTEQLTREAETQALIEHACHTFLRHSSEFLGAWFTVQSEYMPLLVALAPIVKRCAEMTAPTAPLMPADMRPNMDAINPTTNGGGPDVQ